MATRFPKNSKYIPGESTDFQLHKSQQTAHTGIMHQVLDYTEFRLKRYIEQTNDAQQKLVLVALLADYIAGRVAIAWKRGKPIWIRVSKD